MLPTGFPQRRNPALHTPGALPNPCHPRPLRSQVPQEARAKTPKTRDSQPSQLPTRQQTRQHPAWAAASRAAASTRKEGANTDGLLAAATASTLCHAQRSTNTQTKQNPGRRPCLKALGTPRLQRRHTAGSSTRCQLLTRRSRSDTRAAAQTMLGNVNCDTTVRVMLRVVKPRVVSPLMSRHVLGVNKGSVAGRRTTPAQFNPALSHASRQSWIVVNDNTSEGAVCVPISANQSSLHHVYCPADVDLASVVLRTDRLQLRPTSLDGTALNPTWGALHSEAP